MSVEQFAALIVALFLAAAAGWYSARRGSTRSARRRGAGEAAGAHRRHGAERPLRDQYFEGLNFLLNEEPDKALEVFLRMVEVDDETVETHFALGSLYRRRGEVDRSIRVHEGIMARPTLQPKHREHGMFALGEDYFRAGVYDRAEQLFQRLTEMEGRRVGALRYLQRIYEQQAEWPQAIATFERLEHLVSPEYPTAIAHYHCELAELARQRGDYTAAREHLHRMRLRQRNFPRGALIRADIALSLQEPGLAIHLCRRMVELHPQLLPLALPRVMQALRSSDSSELHQGFAAWIRGEGGGRAELAYAAIVAGLEEEPFVADCLREFVRSDPTLGDLVAALAGDATRLTAVQLTGLARTLGRIYRRTQRYRCVECGLGSATHFWQCPGCRSWDGLAPLSRFELGPRARSL